VDHSIVVGHHQLSRSPTPSRVSFIPNGIRIPEALPDFQFWCEPGIDRPLRLVELRRPDKLMSLTLDQIAGTGALDGLDFEGTGIGFDTPSTHPRIQNIGAQANPYPILAQADLLIMGTTTETFGRTVYEAMAWGTLPITTPIPAFRQVFSDQEVGYFSGFELETGARELRKMIDALAQDPRRCRNQREANHRHILQEFSVQCMSEKTESLYGRLSDLPRPPRNFGPEDLEGTTPEAFGFVMDNLLSTEDFYCQEAFTALPPAARGIVLWSLVKTGRALPDQRVPLLARAMQLTGPRPILCMDLASELLTRGDLPRAEALYAQAASLDPADVEAHLCRVDIRIQRGDRPGAFQALREARQANPEVPYLEQLADSLPPS